MSIAADPDASFEALLRYLYETHGSDFTGYKRSSLMRRVQKRLDILQLAGYEAYIDYLEVHPDEHGVLLDTILINVTAFFRDPAAWDYLSAEVVPKIADQRDHDDAIRVWSAGCATGEEAYTAAILFAERLGWDAFRDRVKVYATDIDEEALRRARLGLYTVKELTAVPEALRNKYFEVQGQRGAFLADLRRSVIFGRHDLLQDAPISRIDLLICRNTLMYLNADTQTRVLARLHYALADGGYLFAGRAEMLLTHSNLFAPIDMKHRIFAKVGGANYRRLRLRHPLEQDTIIDQMGRQVRLREAAFDAESDATIVVESGGTLVLANERARSNFGISRGDLGKQLADSEISYRPVELRSLIDQAVKERRPARLENVERVLPSGIKQFLEVLVTPLTDSDGSPLGVEVTFRDVTSASELQNELTKSRQALETANEELQSTNEELQTTNEELQSTVEELETTNEELQSANEELETMNEELQSTNGELQAINTELEHRSAEVDRLNIFIESVLGSLDAGVIALDSEQYVVVWNDRSADLWGLRSDEVVGRPFAKLDIGLPKAELMEPIRLAASGELQQAERTVTALTRRGRTMDFKVTVIGVRGPTGVDGIVLMTEEADGAPRGAGAEELTASRPKTV
jgi:two-component system, chemotaxis family, CheB/CheR fusion protein